MTVLPEALRRSCSLPPPRRVPPVMQGIRFDSRYAQRQPRVVRSAALVAYRSLRSSI